MTYDGFSSVLPRKRYESLIRNTNFVDNLTRINQKANDKLLKTQSRVSSLAESFCKFHQGIIIQ